MPGSRTLRLVWSPAARNDLIRLRDFIGEQNPDAARRAAEALKKAANLLLEHPGIGPRIEDREDRELFVDTLRVKNLNQMAYTLENLSKRIRQSLGEKWGSPAMTGDVFSTDTTFKTLDLLSRSLSFNTYTSRRDAITYLENILEQDPDMATAQLHLGMLYFQLQQPRNALLHISISA